MRVVRDFEKVYREQKDPWNIGKADFGRYLLYFDKILELSNRRGSILDIGCGFGSFLFRFKRYFLSLTGVELNHIAIKKGGKKHPEIQFLQGSADCLEQIKDLGSQYDVIISSDVICYLGEQGKRDHLRSIKELLAKDGLALIAAWTPGGNYLTHSELKKWVFLDFKIEKEYQLKTGHSAFFCRPKRSLIAITVDYETWHPIPEGKKIDWQVDVFEPFEKLLDIGKRTAVCLTFMAEMGEYFWLLKHLPHLAKQMQEQWEKAIAEGHDVQLHIHPNWLPELGAQCENGIWKWDWSKRKPHDYPNDLIELIGRCKKTLEKILKKIDPNYRVTSFRAGAYQAQPFTRLYDALIQNEIFCDSSVYSKGVCSKRGYDYSFAYSEHQPYWANRYDPQLKAPPFESKLLELPIFTYAPAQRWSLDGGEGEVCAERLKSYVKLHRSFLPCKKHRVLKKFKQKIASVYSLFQKTSLNKLLKHLPSPFFEWITHYEKEELVGHDYFVMIGHTKGNHSFEKIEKNLEDIKTFAEFVTLSQMADFAKAELLKTVRLSSQEESSYQIQREYRAVMGSSRNANQSYFLQEMIPLDRTEVLDLGCGAGYWSQRISILNSWMKVTGIDIGEPFIQKAKKNYETKKVHFQVEDFADLSFQSERFDCIYADNTLEHSFDVEQTLAESFRVLKEGGVLVAALPSDARNPKRICDNHTWKTAPHEVRLRLENAGFTEISIEEINTRTQLGMPPYAPSKDMMMYVRAWKRVERVDRMKRALEVMAWVYHKLTPAPHKETLDPREILSRGEALCFGYVLVMGKILEREGYGVKWLTMLAKDHPKGRGDKKIDSHEVLLLEINQKEMIFDPTTNRCIPYSFEEVIKCPALTTSKSEKDQRYFARRYDQYDTPFWYEKVFQYCIRKDLTARLTFQNLKR